ncbi:hypothetical protein JCM3765_007443 [Sporobolomyces pararoseus]
MEPGARYDDQHSLVQELLAKISTPTAQQLEVKGFLINLDPTDWDTLPVNSRTNIVELLTGWITGRDCMGRAVTNPLAYFYRLEGLVSDLKKGLFPRQFQACRAGLAKQDFILVPALYHALRDMSYIFYRTLATIPNRNRPASNGLTLFRNAIEQIKITQGKDYKKVFSETACVAQVCLAVDGSQPQIAALPPSSRQFFHLVRGLSRIDTRNTVPSVCWTVRMSLASLTPHEISLFGSSQTDQIVPIENPVMDGPKFRSEGIFCLQKLESDLSDLAALSKGTTSSKAIVDACDPIDVIAETALGAEEWYHRWDYWGRICGVPTRELHLDPSEDLVLYPHSAFEVTRRSQF